MTTAKHVALTLALTLFAFLATVHAQTPRMATVNITPDADKVHISAIGDVSEMRVDVTDEQGEVVFQSGQMTGQTLDWNMRDSAGERVTAGSYLVTVTYRTASGKLKKRVEQVTVDEAEKASNQAPAAPAATPTPLPVKTTGTVSANRIPKFASIGTTAAAITNSIITESATKIGINTTAPVSKLHIVSASTDNPPRLQATGTTSFAAGWDFYHGTVGKGYVGVPGTGTTIGPGELILFGGPGTKTSLWAGQNRAVTILTNGNVGIGTTTPASGKLQVDGGTGNGVFGSSDIGGTGVYGRSNDGFGVIGSSAHSTLDTSGAGVFGTNTSGGYAGYFDGPVKITGGCTGCTMQSDQSLKANFSTVNPRLVLDRLSAIPIKSWNYKSDDSSIRHIGPMAQDFRTAFNLGVDDKHIDMIDANGVTMASIQALYQMMQEKDRQIEQQELKNKAQSRQIEQLQVQLNQVKRTIKRKRTARR